MFHFRTSNNVYISSSTSTTEWIDFKGVTSHFYEIQLIKENNPKPYLLKSLHLARYLKQAI